MRAAKDRSKSDPAKNVEIVALASLVHFPVEADGLEGAAGREDDLAVGPVERLLERHFALHRNK